MSDSTHNHPPTPTGHDLSPRDRLGSHNRYRVVAATLTLLFVILLAYWPTLSANFVRLDDYQYVVHNESVTHPSWTSVSTFFTEVSKPSTVAGYYHPLTMLSLMFDAAICGEGGPDPFVFHLTNIILHAIVCVLVLLLVRRIVGGVGIPLLIAILFAVHPVQAESVAWISQRKTVLATLFALASLACYLQATGNQSPAQPGKRSSIFWLMASFLLYVLGTLSKPTVLMLPVVMSLLHIWPLRERLTRSVRLLWPFAGWMLVTAWIAWQSQANSSAVLAAPSLHDEGSIVRWVGLLCHNFVAYLGNIFWPTSLSPYRAIPSDMSLGNPAILAATVFTATLAIAWATSWRWSKPFFVGIAGFTILLLPAIGAVRFAASMVADRFLYLPFVFLLLPLAAFAGPSTHGPHRCVHVVDRASFRPWRAIFLSVIAIPLFLLLQTQLGVWHDSHALWTHVHLAVPTLPMANHELGVSYLRRGEPEKALAHAQRAANAEPDNSRFIYSLGRVLVKTNRASEAIPLIRRALANGLGPAQGWGYVLLAEALLAVDDGPGAEDACRQAISFDCDPAEVFAILANAAMQLPRDYTAAAEYYRRVLELRPDADVIRWNRGTALVAAGRDAEALAEYEKVIEAYMLKGIDTAELQAAAAKVRSRLVSPSTTTTTQP